jgi:glycine cleavage system protein P-like pyridoxal-binding family
MPYSPHTAADRRHMLDAIGISSIDELFAMIPSDLRHFPFDVPSLLSEFDLQRRFQRLAARNTDALQRPIFLGAGAYFHYIPAAVPALASRGEFSTSYTPYQPEVSQGTLQAMYEFQSMICALMGMDAANASVYDGATALAEATTMARNITGRDTIAVPPTLHPHYLSVLQAYGVPVRELPGDVRTQRRLDPAAIAGQIDDTVAALVVPSPNVLGVLEDWAALAELAHAKGALLIAVANPIALGLLASPGACGADIAVAEGQPLGIPPAFGGPALGLMATRSRYLRHLPGRIIGAAKDREGRDGFVLTLRAREQDIRRERATSNICTNQSLVALQAAIYLSLLGPQGLREIAGVCTQRAHFAAQQIAALPGFAVSDDPFFHEFVVQCPGPAAELVDRLLAHGVIAGLPLGRWYPSLANSLMVCVTETHTPDDIAALVAALGETDEEMRRGGDEEKDLHPSSTDSTAAGSRFAGRPAAASPVPPIPSSPHPLISSSPANRAEPLIFELGAPGRRGPALPVAGVPETPLERLIPDRHIRREALPLPEVAERDVVGHFTRLSQLNFSVDAGMYPLGSCTMKYNPRVNEQVANLPGFAQIHPLQPEQTVQGALALLYELQQALLAISGMEACSLQPAAGAHGELTGMLIIRAYHRARGDDRRTVVLVPASAHGTNPATAHMCGYTVREIPTNDRGGVDLAALEDALDDTVAGLMLTNPSTYGLFERDVVRLTELVHRAGGQVYGDGANLNAILGIARPGDMGFDVMHFNTHKTFSTPHGGGGPGAGPVTVKAHLAPFLPAPLVAKDGKRYFLDEARPQSIGHVRAFWGSFGILVRADAYIRAHGPAGLREVSEDAVLAANYLRVRLRDRYPARYDTSCMHETLLQATRWRKEGLGALDVAKRLLDYGFHAPTIYFPLGVPEAMLIEPTETESVETLDRFVDAMLAIAKEADTNSDLLRQAPTTTPYRRFDEVAAARRPNVCYPSCCFG